MFQRSAARRNWANYFEQSDAIVFIVDTSDEERIPEAKIELDVCSSCISEKKEHLQKTLDDVMLMAKRYCLSFICWVGLARIPTATSQGPATGESSFPHSGQQN